MGQGNAFPELLWRGLDELEELSTASVLDGLTNFVPALRNCYEAGVMAPTLASSDRSGTDLQIAALCLKRVLADLRSVWLLLLAGYTAQAAVVAASLWEHALAATCVAGHPERADAVINSRGGDIPWTPSNMAEMAVQGHDGFQRSAELRAIELYAAYKWLCKVKHPTLRSLTHDAGATAIFDTRDYAVMATPDFRAEDLPVKALVLTIAISRTLESAQRFVKASQPDESHERFTAFRDRADSAQRSLTAAYKEATGRKPLPFTLKTDAIERRYRDLRGRGD